METNTKRDVLENAKQQKEYYEQALFSFKAIIAIAPLSVLRTQDSYIDDLCQQLKDTLTRTAQYYSDAGWGVQMLGVSYYSNEEHDTTRILFSDLLNYMQRTLSSIQYMVKYSYVANDEVAIAKQAKAIRHYDDTVYAIHHIAQIYKKWCEAQGINTTLADDMIALHSAAKLGQETQPDDNRLNPRMGD